MNDLNFEGFENMEPENFENFAKKPNPIKKASAILNLKIVNNTGAAQVVELFNPNASVALINNPAISTLNPFTAADVTAANTNNLIYFNRAGNLVYDVAAGLMTTSCTNSGVTYRQLFESCKTMRFRIYKIMYTSVSDAQAENGLNFFYRSTFGKQTTNEITPSSFRDPINNQTKLLKMEADFRIDCESGLSHRIEIGETVTLNLYIDNIDRGVIWPKN